MKNAEFRWAVANALEIAVYVIVPAELEEARAEFDAPPRIQDAARLHQVRMPAFAVLKADEEEEEDDESTDVASMGRICMFAPCARSFNVMEGYVNAREGLKRVFCSVKCAECYRAAVAAGAVLH